jgi:hypothetical protein
MGEPDLEEEGGGGRRRQIQVTHDDVSCSGRRRCSEELRKVSGTALVRRQRGGARDVQGRRCKGRARTRGGVVVRGERDDEQKCEHPALFLFLKLT